MDLGYEWFIQKIYERSGIDLRYYKRTQMERRINALMRSMNIDNYAEYLRLLVREPAHYRKFIDHLTINVSEFYRNPQHWEVLEKKILPELKAANAHLKIWSAGCSTGEEPYTLAIIVSEQLCGTQSRILATDIDRGVLAKAKEGVYSSKAVANVPPRLLEKYFERNGDHFVVRDSLKQLITWRQHDLLCDEFPTQCDLILCRNVVIYFTEEAKSKLYQRFAQALRKGGVLFIGSTEQIFQARELGLSTKATFFYQKN